MIGQKLSKKRISRGAYRFRWNAASLGMAAAILLGCLLVASPRIGISQPPSAASTNRAPVSNGGSADAVVPTPLVLTRAVAVRSTPNANQLVLKDKVAQGPAKRRSADSQPTGKQSSGKQSTGKQRRNLGGVAQPHHAFRLRPHVTEEDEAAVRSFVKEHHPELASVLDSLRDTHTHAYTKALADLNRNRERLRQIQSRDETRYERELAMWKTKSRLQLLVARIKLNPTDAALRAEFKSLVGMQLRQHRERLEAERQRLKQRLEKNHEQMARLSGDTDQLVESQMKQGLASGEFALRKQAQKRGGEARRGNSEHQKGNSAKPRQVKVKTKKSATEPVRVDVKEADRP